MPGILRRNYNCDWQQN